MLGTKEFKHEEDDASEIVIDEDNASKIVADKDDESKIVTDDDDAGKIVIEEDDAREIVTDEDPGADDGPHDDGAALDEAECLLQPVPLLLLHLLQLLLLLHGLVLPLAVGGAHLGTVKAVAVRTPGLGATTGWLLHLPGLPGTLQLEYIM